MIGVLALQGDVREHLRTLRDLGVHALAVRRPAELELCDGLVIPGGESTTMAKLARTFELFEPLQKRIADGMPAFGTCAGMILLANRLTDAEPPVLCLLDATVQRNAYGRQLDSFEADLDVPALGDVPLHGVFIRAPVVSELGPDVEVLARDDAGRPIAVRQGRVLATAFHPELTGDRRLHRLLVDMIREDAAE